MKKTILTSAFIFLLSIGVYSKPYDVIRDGSKAYTLFDLDGNGREELIAYEITDNPEQLETKFSWKYLKTIVNCKKTQKNWYNRFEMYLLNDNKGGSLILIGSCWKIAPDGEYPAGHRIYVYKLINNKLTLIKKVVSNYDFKWSEGSTYDEKMTDDPQTPLGRCPTSNCVYNNNKTGLLLDFGENVYSLNAAGELKKIYYEDRVDKIIRAYRTKNNEYLILRQMPDSKGGYKYSLWSSIKKYNEIKVGKSAKSCKIYDEENIFVLETENGERTYEFDDKTGLVSERRL